MFPFEKTCNQSCFRKRRRGVFFRSSCASRWQWMLRIGVHPNDQVYCHIRSLVAARTVMRTSNVPQLKRFLVKWLMLLDGNSALQLRAKTDLGYDKKQSGPYRFEPDHGQPWSKAFHRRNTHTTCDCPNGGLFWRIEITFSNIKSRNRGVHHGLQWMRRQAIYRRIHLPVPSPERPRLRVHGNCQNGRQPRTGYIQYVDKTLPSG